MASISSPPKQVRTPNYFQPINPALFNPANIEDAIRFNGIRDHIVTNLQGSKKLLIGKKLTDWVEGCDPDITPNPAERPTIHQTAMIFAESAALLIKKDVDVETIRNFVLSITGGVVGKRYFDSEISKVTAPPQINF